MFFRLGLLAGRLVVATFVLLTGGYCLLAYIPFTFHQIHMGGLLPWLSSFAQYHPIIYWPVFVVAAATLPNMRNDRSRLLSVIFLFVYLMIGIDLALHPLLSKLQNNTQSLYWALLSLLPLLWLGLLDWRARRGDFVWAAVEGSDARRIFFACMLSATWAWLLSALLVLMRYSADPHAGFQPAQWGLALTWSFACHAVLFMVVFLALSFAGALASLGGKNPAVLARSYILMATLLLALALKLIVFTPLSFSGTLSILVALAAAFSIVAFFTGISVRFYRKQQGPIESPLALFLTPIRFLRSNGRLVQALVLLAGSALGGYLIVRISTMDWEYMVQKLLVAGIWAALFAFFYTTAPAFRRRGGDWLLVISAAVVCAYVGVVALQPRWISRAAGGDNAEFVDEYGNYDISFRLAREVLLPPAAMAASSDDALYGFLVGNTNIPRSIPTHPVEVKLAGDLTETSGPKLNIFIFVIDSLRRDYVSPYNPAVNFTPAIGAFAGESVVVPNAFTRYTGTGLSEPSIWSGSMLLHKQYVLPFYPMNSLQKLLNFEKYQQFITKDEILSNILAPSPLITELDAGRPTMSCELCQSLKELETRISSYHSDQPIFAYTQPQNIHVSVINREGSSVPAGENYPGFNNAYASRVKAMDKCFGEFIQFLKNNGLYDNSILVLTSDHGDSLGERGRWGHAYNVVPEVARVPLIIHLPPVMRDLSFDAAAPSFLIDITPSLYYLLGHHPIASNDLFGRPLFTQTPQEIPRYLRSSYVIASSYGPVYGLLENDGHSLYVADGVEYTDHLYEWGEGPSVSSSVVTAEIRADRQQQIRDYINKIAQFYSFSETAQR